MLSVHVKKALNVLMFYTLEQQGGVTWQMIRANQQKVILITLSLKDKVSVLSHFLDCASFFCMP